MSRQNPGAAPGSAQPAQSRAGFAQPAQSRAGFAQPAHPHPEAPVDVIADMVNGGQTLCELETVHQEAMRNQEREVRAGRACVRTCAGAGASAVPCDAWPVQYLISKQQNQMCF